MAGKSEKAAPAAEAVDYEEISAARRAWRNQILPDLPRPLTPEIAAENEAKIAAHMAKFKYSPKAAKE